MYDAPTIFTITQPVNMITSAIEDERQTPHPQRPEQEPDREWPQHNPPKWDPPPRPSDPPRPGRSKEAELPGIEPRTPR